MEYNYRSKKIVAVLNSKLSYGAALNVLGHLAVSIGYHAQDHIGRKVLVDGSKVEHLGISRYPIIVTKVKPSKLRTVVEKAREDARLLISDYPQQMLETGHDDELAESLADVEEANIEYLGAMLYGPSNAVDAITGRFSLWK